MRKRNIRVQIWLNDIEYEKLKEDAEKENITISEHIRKLIVGARLKEKPDYKFYEVMKELTKIGINLNQIAKKVNSLNLIDKDKYLQEANTFKNFKERVINEYL